MDLFVQSQSQIGKQQLIKKRQSKSSFVKQQTSSWPSSTPFVSSSESLSLIASTNSPLSSATIPNDASSVSDSVVSACNSSTSLSIQNHPTTITTFPSSASTCIDLTSATINHMSNVSSFGPKGKRPTFEKQEKVRITVEVYFERHLHTNYLPEQLPSYIKVIYHTFKLKCHSTMKKVILDIKMC